MTSLKPFGSYPVGKLIFRTTYIEKGKKRKEKKLNEKYKTVCTSRGVLCPYVVILNVFG